MKVTNGQANGRKIFIWAQVFSAGSGAQLLILAVGPARLRRMFAGKDEGHGKKHKLPRQETQIARTKTKYVSGKR